MEVEAHGQELTTEFLDHMFVSLRDSVPINQWVEIRKNHDLAVASIKHIIDLGYYGHNMEITFNDSFTHFKKRVHKELQPHPFLRKYVTDHLPEYWAKQDQLVAQRQKRDYQRAMDEIEKGSKPKYKKRGSRR